jgi:hypothetical protein
MENRIGAIIGAAFLLGVLVTAGFWVYDRTAYFSFREQRLHRTLCNTITSERTDVYEKLIQRGHFFGLVVTGSLGEDIIPPKRLAEIAWKLYREEAEEEIEYFMELAHISKAKAKILFKVGILRMLKMEKEG